MAAAPNFPQGNVEAYPGQYFGGILSKRFKAYPINQDDHADVNGTIISKRYKLIFATLLNFFCPKVIVRFKQNSVC
jgi:hypothetical protein